MENGIVKAPAFLFEGLALWNDFEDGIPRVLNVDLGERMNMSRPRDIRQTIEKSMNDLNDMGFCGQRAQNHDGGRGRPSTEYYLNRDQALYIVGKSDTEAGRRLYKLLVKAFGMLLDGKLVSSSQPVPTALDLRAAREKRLRDQHDLQARKVELRREAAERRAQDKRDEAERRAQDKREAQTGIRTMIDRCETLFDDRERRELEIIAAQAGTGIDLGRFMAKPSAAQSYRSPPPAPSAYRPPDLRLAPPPPPPPPPAPVDDVWLSCTQIANWFGVSPQCVGAIVNEIGLRNHPDLTKSISTPDPRGILREGSLYRRDAANRIGAELRALGKTAKGDLPEVVSFVALRATILKN